MASGFKGVIEDSRIERLEPRLPGRLESSKPMMKKDFSYSSGARSRTIRHRFRGHRRSSKCLQASVSATVATIRPVLNALDASIFLVNTC